MRFSFLGGDNVGVPLARNILLAGESVTIFSLKAE